MSSIEKVAVATLFRRKATITFFANGYKSIYFWAFIPLVYGWKPYWIRNYQSVDNGNQLC